VHLGHNEMGSAMKHATCERGERILDLKNYLHYRDWVAINRNAELNDSQKYKAAKDIYFKTCKNRSKAMYKGTVRPNTIDEDCEDAFNQVTAV
jgi:hypothetical protein